MAHIIRPRRVGQHKLCPHAAKDFLFGLGQVVEGVQRAGRRVQGAERAGCTGGGGGCGDKIEVFTVLRVAAARQRCHLDIRREAEHLPPAAAVQVRHLYPGKGFFAQGTRVTRIAAVQDDERIPNGERLVDPDKAREPGRAALIGMGAVGLAAQHNLLR